MEQIPKTLPPPPAAEMDSSFESNPKPGVAQMPETAQFPKPPPPQRTLEMRPMPNSTTKPRASTARADWVNTLWADVSGQLRRFAVISNDLFDGLLLRRDTITGSLVLRELVSNCRAFVPGLLSKPIASGMLILCVRSARRGNCLAMREIWPPSGFCLRRKRWVSCGSCCGRSNAIGIRMVVGLLSPATFFLSKLTNSLTKVRPVLLSDDHRPHRASNAFGT